MSKPEQHELNEATNNPNKKFRVIGILSALGKDGIFYGDAIEDYLHIHIMEDDASLQSIEKLAEIIKNIPDSGQILHQFSTIGNLEDYKKSFITVGQLKEVFGGDASAVFGLGAASNGADQEGNYKSKGEGFSHNGLFYRIVKGGEAILMEHSETNWIYEVVKFDEKAKSINSLEGSVINGRKELMELLNAQAGHKPYVVVFDAEFLPEVFTRSFGDADNMQGITHLTADVGGHLVTGAPYNRQGILNETDLGSLRQKFSEEEARLVDFKIKIVSKVLMQVVNRTIVHEEDGTRKQYTNTQVAEATEKFMKILEEAAKYKPGDPAKASIAALKNESKSRL